MMAFLSKGQPNAFLCLLETVQRKERMGKKRRIVSVFGVLFWKHQKQWIHQNYFCERMYYLWPVVHSFVISHSHDFYLFIWFCVVKNCLARQYVALFRSMMVAHQKLKMCTKQNQNAYTIHKHIFPYPLYSHTHIRILGKIMFFLSCFDALIFDLREAQENSMQMIFLYNPM